MKNNMIQNVTRMFGKTGLKLKKHSPEILTVVGVVGTVTGAVMACRATTKVSDVMEESKKRLDVIHESEENEDAKKDLTVAYAKTGLDFAKLYGPSVAIGVAGISCLLAANGILHKRYVASAAAYLAVDKSFKEYRSRVIDRFGKDLDHELKYNIVTKKFTDVETDENGKEKKVKKDIPIIEGLDGYSDYARFFDETADCWVKDAEDNLMFLRAQMQYANNLLVANGYLFLNDVYKMLGIQPTKAGQLVGWIYSENNPVGDNFVDFGIYDGYREKNRDFVNGYERSILLDFNVDGNILDLL